MKVTNSISLELMQIFYLYAHSKNDRCRHFFSEENGLTLQVLNISRGQVECHKKMLGTIDKVVFIEDIRGWLCAFLDSSNDWGYFLENFLEVIISLNKYTHSNLKEKCFLSWSWMYSLIHIIYTMGNVLWY